MFKTFKFIKKIVSVVMAVNAYYKGNEDKIKSVGSAIVEVDTLITTAKELIQKKSLEK